MSQRTQDTVGIDLAESNAVDADASQCALTSARSLADSFTTPDRLAALAKVDESTAKPSPFDCLHNRGLRSEELSRPALREWRSPRELVKAKPAKIAW